MTTTTTTTSVLLKTFLRSGQTTFLNSFFRSLNQPAMREKKPFFSLSPFLFFAGFFGVCGCCFVRLLYSSFLPGVFFLISHCLGPPLLCLSVQRMLPAELAVFVHFNPVRIVPLVLLGNIVATLAFCASQCYFHSHDRHLLLVYFFRYAEAGSPAVISSLPVLLPPSESA